MDERVREAYEPIFDQIDVEEASQADIEGAFVNQYGLGDTRRYVRAFGAFARHAGMTIPALAPRVAAASTGATTTERPSKDRPPVGRSERRQKPDPAPRGPSGGGRAGSAGSAAINVNVEIPADWTEDQIKERLATVRRALEDSGS